MSESRKGGWQMVMMPPLSQWAVDGCVKPHEWKISEQDIMNMSFYVFLSTQNVSAGRPRAIRATHLKKSQNIKNECWYSSLCLSDKLFSQCREHFLFGKTQINIHEDVSHSSYQVIRLFFSSPCAPQQHSLATLEYKLQSYWTEQ